MAATLGPRLIVPLDGSTMAAQALPVARQLAAPEAEVMFLQARAGGGTTPAEDASVRQQLAALATEVRRDRPDLRVDVVVASGNPAPAILQVAAERAVDLIVLASRGHRVPATRIPGSVADQVAAATPCPIFIVRADAAAGARIARDPASDRAAGRVDAGGAGADRGAVAGDALRRADLPADGD
ncbi:MAG TPA: universal stress protein [Thermomicrobiales bacterium]|nr:universal stress protein [Thermomicrobiales bacterium]